MSALNVDRHVDVTLEPRTSRISPIWMKYWTRSAASNGATRLFWMVEKGVRMAKPTQQVIWDIAQESPLIHSIYLKTLEHHALISIQWEYVLQECFLALHEENKKLRQSYEQHLNECAKPTWR